MMLTDMLSSFTNTEGKGKTILLTIAVAAPTFYLSMIDYSFLWRYVGWTNQVVATVMLWTGAMYLLKSNKLHWICGIPAMFMTGVVCTYIFYAPEGLKLAYETSLIIGSTLTLVVAGWYAAQIIKYRRLNKGKKAFKVA
jgi:carbon starvation protein CstA